MSRLRIFLPVDISFCHIRLYYPPTHPSPTYLPFPLLHLILILYLPVLLSYHGPRQKIHDDIVPRDSRFVPFDAQPTLLNQSTVLVVLLYYVCIPPFPAYDPFLHTSLARHT